MNVFVFDIETVPDVRTGRRLHELDDLSDQEIANVLFCRRQQETEGATEFLKHFLHRIVAISAVLRSDERLSVWSLGTPDSSEAELIERFFDGIERFSPTLVSWNGSGFDLPVLHYRALLHGIPAPRYWELGDEDRDFRWNNYLNRFHERHTDLMDVLSGYQARAAASLNDIAVLLGLPGKLGMDGSAVWDCYLNGDFEAIRNYCETDVLNTYLVYLRYELIRGRLCAADHSAECARLRTYLHDEGKPHFAQFLDGWQG